MKFPIDFPPARKALGIAFVAVVTYVIVEGTGIGVAPKQLVSALTAQVKTLFSKLSGDYLQTETISIHGTALTDPTVANPASLSPLPTGNTARTIARHCCEWSCRPLVKIVPLAQARLAFLPQFMQYPHHPGLACGSCRQESIHDGDLTQVSGFFSGAIACSILSSYAGITT